MHELSLSEAIAKVVLGHVGGRRVESVRLRVGTLRQVVPESLTFCWEIVSQQPLLEGARLEIERIPAVVECSECGVRSVLAGTAMRCPGCGSGLVAIVQGEEFLVTSIDVADAPPDRTSRRVSTPIVWRVSVPPSPW